MPVLDNSEFCGKKQKLLTNFACFQYQYGMKKFYIVTKFEETKVTAVIVTHLKSAKRPQ